MFEICSQPVWNPVYTCIRIKGNIIPSVIFRASEVIDDIRGEDH
jgi:hypothetical protein